MAVSRRHLLQSVAAGALAATHPIAPSPVAAALIAKPRLGLGFSLYGMRKLPLARAAAVCAETGYDCVELPVMKGWPADSATFNEPQQKEFAATLKRHQLRLSAIMENLPILGDDKAHQRSLARLRQAAAVGRSLTRQPVIETILGGRPAQWEQVRAEMARRLEDWARVAEEEQAVIAIKAHVGGAMHLPQHPLTLVKQVDSPHVRAAYDYSHFRLRGVDLEESVRTLAKASVFVHVKDAAGDASKVRFLLPGEGDIAYDRLLPLLIKHGYQGDIVVEVSGQIHGRPDYDPVAAAQRSYTPLAKAMEKAGIVRLKRG